MKKLLLTFSLALSSALATQAQTYSLNHFDQEYSALTAGITLNANSWFYHSYDIPLPFAVKVFGDEIKNLSISNGILYADSKNTDKIQYQLFAQSAELLDAGYIFNPGGPATPSESPLKYQVDGVAGNRILKIDVANAVNGNEYFENDTKTMRINFQMWFYEATEQIEFRYGANTITDFDLFFNDYSSNEVKTPNFAVMLAKTILVTNEFDQEESELIEVYSLQGTSESPTGALSSSELGRLDSYPNSGRVFQFKNANLGIDKKAPGTIALYPNPTTDVLHLALDQEVSAVAYTIFNVLGKSVQSGVYQNNQAPILVSDLSQGIYFIKVGNYKTVKFIKK
ncbi:T9SS type A sorting domain-containing protein [Flavobacterium sp. JP2137]|uniref:T9SS type A sorting domain-containing protein n=1 Tax=Flavobacterium sp. JP2137 TaxID=3414510 RepID=UPI003D2FC86A